MTRPWITLATAPTREGALELRRRGDRDFLITIGGRVLMNSFARSSEEKLATLALAHLRGGSPRVLIGGLGMGFTLRAALDVLPPRASVVVAELNPVIVEWCKGPLAEATRNAVGDPRVRIEIGDVARLIDAAKPGAYDAIVLDLYEGPNAGSQRRDDPFYSPRAIASQRAALAPAGVLAVWSEDPDASYAKRLGAELSVVPHTIAAGGSGGRKHVVYLATAAAAPSDARRRR